MAAPDPPPRGRAGRWLLLTLTVLYLGTTRGHFIGTDEIAAYHMTRSLWERGDLTVGYIVNTFPGRDGRTFSQYEVGQSVAALPLYGLGKAVRAALERAGRRDWVKTFAGPSIGAEPSRWGGDVEMFFVNLLNGFVTALCCAVLYALARRLGASARAAAAAALLLGTTSYLGPFATGFLRHSGEALLLLAAVYFLVLDARQASGRARAWAGVMVALGVHVRVASGVTWPALGLFLGWSIWRRRERGAGAARMIARAAREIAPFAAPVALGIALHFAVAWIKFETIWGKYNNEGFRTPLAKGLYAFLLSPGDSIFLFSPLLVLAPWTFKRCWGAHRAVAALLLGLAASYLCFYGKYTRWEGLWSALGPRYLVPVTPLLMLPLAGWIDARGRAAWWAIAPLAAVGLLVQAVHVAVSFAYVYHFERYEEWEPEFGFLFIPDRAPIVAHARALAEADYRVDMWLVNVYRELGAGRMLVLAVPLALALAACAWRLVRSVRSAG